MNIFQRVSESAYAKCYPVLSEKGTNSEEWNNIRNCNQYSFYNIRSDKCQICVHAPCLILSRCHIRHWCVWIKLSFLICYHFIYSVQVLHMKNPITIMYYDYYQHCWITGSTDSTLSNEMCLRFICGESNYRRENLLSIILEKLYHFHLKNLRYLSTVGDQSCGKFVFGHDWFMD